MKRYTVTVRILGVSARDERSVRVVAESPDDARERAAKRLYGRRAFWRGDLSGMPHIGQFWVDRGVSSGGWRADAATGRAAARVEDGW